MGEAGFVSAPDRGSPETRHRGPCELGAVAGWQGRSQGAGYRAGRVLACRALSVLGDGFCSFNFSFAFCGVPELYEIDHPLIG